MCYAAGDVTSFPIKQGGLAAQQADVVAAAIAAGAGVPIDLRPFAPVMRGLLLTGGAPLYLRCEPGSVTNGSGVAVESRRNGEAASSAAGQPLWWPPAKLAARHLAPYLATATAGPLEAEQLLDRAPIPGPPTSQAEHDEAFELALLLADCDARWGDYRSALDALATAEAVHGALPPEYEAKRREWRAPSGR